MDDDGTSPTKQHRHDQTDALGQHSLSQEMFRGLEKQAPAMLMNVKKLPTVDQEKDPMTRWATLELLPT